MDLPLTDVDVRVLGSLIEKEATTPDNYPLSLNSLVAACNQTSNRTPVVSFDDDTVMSSIVRLRRQSLLRAIQPAESRVTKYQHLLADALSLSHEELALMGVLMLRGPQTVGELRTRTERLAKFESLTTVEATLTTLSERTPSLVVRLPRQPGQKEQRYAHLLAGEPAPSPDVVASPARSPAAHDERIDALEQTVADLRSDVDDLRRQFAEFRKQFE